MKKNMKKNLLWMLLSLMAAAIMMPLSATAQTRIAVVSDIHVMEPSLLPNEAKTKDAWKNYYADQRKMLEQSARLFDQFVETMSTEKPDILLITGDLTKDGEQLSHNYVKAGLETLKDAGIKVYVIPGNHDFGDEGNHTQFNADGSTGNADPLPKTGENGFASFYADYGYSGSTPDTEGNSLSYVAEPVSDLVLLAIDSHSGSVDPATLTWICNQALSARAHGKRVIAMMHHPLFPHITGAEFFATSYTVANYTTVRDALIAAGVNVILTGHFHTSDIAYDWNDNQANGIYDINTGSLISYPCDYRMLTLSDKSTLSIKTKSLTATPALIPSGSTSWKDWLHDRIKTITENQTKSKIRQKIIDDNPTWDETKVNTTYNGTITFFSSTINYLAEFAADLYILHAEGNEPVSPENGEYSNYYDQAGNYDLSASSLGYNPNFSNMTRSMLEDKSNYGNDHENQTADRAIVINLANPDPSNLLLELDNNDDNNSIINYYLGKTATVTLTGRTLYKDGLWNTICLPFDIDNIDAKANEEPIWPLYDATILQLDTESVPEGGEKTGIYTYDNYSKLYLNFSAPTTRKILAGVPYIVKWNSGEDITNPSFSGVTIKNTTPEPVTSYDGSITFVGTYAWQQFTAQNTSLLLIGIGKNNDKSVLYYPQPALTNPNQEFNADTNPWIYPSLGACRAYFQLANNYNAGTPEDPAYGPGIRNFVLNFGDDDSTTGIIAIGNSQSSTLNAQRSEWFTLDGRRLAAKPTAKGLYIHAGRKVVIK